MSSRPVSVVVFLLLGSVFPASTQVCEDRDGDGAQFGFSCATSTDCEDRSWSRHPGAADVCDGWDNDCNGDLDSGGCDRSCDFPFLFGQNTEFVNEGTPTASLTACSTLTDYGILVVVGRVYKIQGQADNVLFYARAYDRRGRPLGPSYAAGDPSQVNPYERRCALSYAGDRALFVWQDGHTRTQSSYRLMARVLDVMGQPLSSPIDLTSTAPVGSGTWLYHAPSWDGARFAVFWVPYSMSRYLFMSVIEADATGAQPTTRIVTDHVDAAFSTLQQVVAVWTGTRYLVGLWHDGTAPNNNVNMLSVDREGMLLTNVAVPVFGADLALVLGLDRAAMFSARKVLPFTTVKVMFFDLNGNYLTTPGIVNLMQVSSNYNPNNLKASWSGEQFGAVFASIESGQTSDTPRLHFFRVLPNGTNLDPGGRLLAQGPTHDNAYALAWTGDEWMLVESRLVASEYRMFLERTVCSCSDLDGDTYDACLELDCDDHDASVHPGAVEICFGGKDDDCDGLVDCDDPDCPGGIDPQDPTDLHWEGNQLRWTSPTGSQRFDLARGLLGDIIRRGDLLMSECPGLELSTPQWTDDSRKPAPGEVLWYLVRAEGQPCSYGGWGDGTPARDVKACR